MFFGQGFESYVCSRVWWGQGLAGAWYGGGGQISSQMHNATHTHPHARAQTITITRACVPCGVLRTHPLSVSSPVFFTAVKTARLIIMKMV